MSYKIPASTTIGFENESGENDDNSISLNLSIGVEGGTGALAGDVELLYLLTLTLAGAVTHSPPPILAAADVDVEEMFVCKHDDNDNCSCRKPKPGMILDAITRHNLHHDECIMIGDSLKDLKAASAAGIDAFLLDTNYNAYINYSYKYCLKRRRIFRLNKN